MVMIAGIINGLRGAGERLLFYLYEELWLKGLGVKEPQGCPEKVRSLVELVCEAHREWELAKRLFEEVRDPELVDHAIYAMEAAERKYIYLLRQAKKENVIDETIYQIQHSELV